VTLRVLDESQVSAKVAGTNKGPLLTNEVIEKRHRKTRILTALNLARKVFSINGGQVHDF
jgi:hypothetical protein